MVLIINTGTGPTLTKTMPDGSTCYEIAGNVTVYQRMRREPQFYVLLKSKASRRQPPFPCTDYDPNTGCGGHGSW